MSTALFLNTQIPISKKHLLKIEDYFRQNGVNGVDFRYNTKGIKIKGEIYYFDSMWTPFLKPLSAFKKLNVDKYKELNLIFEATKWVISYLLNENHSVKLFFASVEDKEILIKGQARLKFSEINEYRSFEWGTIYEIGK